MLDLSAEIVPEMLQDRGRNQQEPEYQDICMVSLDKPASSAKLPRHGKIAIVKNKQRDVPEECRDSHIHAQALRAECMDTEHTFKQQPVGESDTEGQPHADSQPEPPLEPCTRKHADAYGY